MHIMFAGIPTSSRLYIWISVIIVIISFSSSHCMLTECFWGAIVFGWGIKPIKECFDFVLLLNSIKQQACFNYYSWFQADGVLNENCTQLNQCGIFINKHKPCKGETECGNVIINAQCKCTSLSCTKLISFPTNILYFHFLQQPW